MFRRLCHVDGARLAADNGFTFAMTNPTDGSLLGSVPNAGAVSRRVRATCHPRAVAVANDIEFGLASYFYVRDIGPYLARGAGALTRFFAKLKPL